METKISCCLSISLSHSLSLSCPFQFFINFPVEDSLLREFLSYSTFLFIKRKIAQSHNENDKISFSEKTKAKFPFFRRWIKKNWTIATQLIFSPKKCWKKKKWRKKENSDNHFFPLFLMFILSFKFYTFCRYNLAGHTNIIFVVFLFFFHFVFCISLVFAWQSRTFLVI